MLLGGNSKGIQHYGVSLRFHSKASLDEGKEIDAVKSQLCAQKGEKKKGIPISHFSRSNFY
jgi:hypothetical protein